MIAIGLGLAALALASQPTLNSAQPTVETEQRALSPLTEESLLLFAVQLDSLTLSEALAAYHDPSDPFLPIGEIARLLDLDIDVSAATGRVMGRLGESARSLLVDLPTGTVQLSGVQIPLSASDFATSATDIYVRASALERLLPARFRVDAEALTIAVEPLETLPIQARLQRIARARTSGQDFEQPEAVTPISSPYELLTWPSFDVILDASRNERSNSFATRYDVRIAGDLLYTSFQGFFGSDERGRLSDARILFERRSLTGDLLGPLGATRVSGGDVFTPALALGPRSVGGRGFSFTTAPFEQASVFDTIDLRGELPTGYDVELYINDVLRSGQRTPVQGRYEFLDVQLVRGINIIRVVLYGPRGERSEQVRVVNVGGGQLAKGQTIVDFGVVEQDRPLLGLRNDPDPLLNPLAGQVRLVGSVSYGLSEGVTLVAGAASYPSVTGSRRQSALAGIRTSLMGMAVHADAAFDLAGGRALGVGVAGQPLGVTMVGQHFEYRGGFVDENQIFQDAGRALRRHSELTLDFTLPKIGGVALPLSVRASRDQFSDGGTNLLANIRASNSLASTLLSVGVDYQRRSVPGAPLEQQLGGSIAASRYLNYKWQLRAVLDYALLPSAEPRSLTFTADRAISDRAAFRFGVGHTFGRPRSTVLQVGANLRTSIGDLALTGEYAVPSGGWSLGVRFAFGLGYDNAARRYRVTGPGPASGGSVAFSAFIDRNANGRFDAGEDPVPNVRVEGGERPGVTNAQGQAFIIGLGTAPTVRLQVGTDRIDNFYVSAPPAALQFSPRPGRVVEIAYPLTPSAEIVTRLVFQRGSETIGLSAVRVRLIPVTGEPRVATTEFDGTIVFSELPVGRYRLELDPEQAERLHMRLTTPITVDVTADENVVQEIVAEVTFDRPVQEEAQ